MVLLVVRCRYVFKCNRSPEGGPKVFYPVNALAFHPQWVFWSFKASPFVDESYSSVQIYIICTIWMPLCTEHSSSRIRRSEEMPCHRKSLAIGGFLESGRPHMILVLLEFDTGLTRIVFLDILCRFWAGVKYCRYGTLATGSGDRHVNVWDIRTKKRIFQVP